MADPAVGHGSTLVVGLGAGSFRAVLVPPGGGGVIELSTTGAASGPPGAPPPVVTDPSSEAGAPRAVDTLEAEARKAPGVEATAALLRRVAHDAARHNRGRRPDQVGLVHPAGWDDAQLRLSRLGAAVAGLGAVELVAAPAAAAEYCVGARSTAPGGPAERVVAVYQLDEDWFEGAVVRETDHGWDVLSHAGTDRPTNGPDRNDETIELLAGAIAGAGLAPAEMDAVCAVGNAPGLAAAAAMLGQRLGVVVITPAALADAVVIGASRLVAGAPEEVAPSTGANPLRPPPAPTPPGSGGRRRRVVAAALVVALVVGATFLVFALADRAGEPSATPSGDVDADSDDTPPDTPPVTAPSVAPTIATFFADAIADAENCDQIESRELEATNVLDCTYEESGVHSRFRQWPDRRTMDAAVARWADFAVGPTLTWEREGVAAGRYVEVVVVGSDGRRYPGIFWTYDEAGFGVGSWNEAGGGDVDAPREWWEAYAEGGGVGLATSPAP